MPQNVAQEILAADFFLLCIIVAQSDIPCLFLPHLHHNRIAPMKKSPDFDVCHSIHQLR
jgi:hypothetical protein